MNQSEIARRADFARQQANRAAVAYESATDEFEKARLRDMVLVWATVAEGLGRARSEHEIRTIIHDLNLLFERGLDANAFTTGLKLVEELREMLGDVYVDEGPVSRTVDEAVQFLRSSLSDQEQETARDVLRDPDSMARWKLGMAIRNRLRTAGFTEGALDIENLDDIRLDLLKSALRQQK